MSIAAFTRHLQLVNDLRTASGWSEAPNSDIESIVGTLWSWYLLSKNWTLASEIAWRLFRVMQTLHLQDCNFYILYSGTAFSGICICTLVYFCEERDVVFSIVGLRTSISRVVCRIILRLKPLGKIAGKNGQIDLILHWLIGWKLLCRHMHAIRRSRCNPRTTHQMNYSPPRPQQICSYTISTTVSQPQHLHRIHAAVSLSMFKDQLSNSPVDDVQQWRWRQRGEYSIGGWRESLFK